MSSDWTLPEDGEIPVDALRLEGLQAYLGCTTQKQLAMRIGISPRSVSFCMSGVPISSKLYHIVLNKLGITDPKQLDGRYRAEHIAFATLLGSKSDSSVAGAKVSGLPLLLPSVEWDPTWMPPGALLRADLGVVEFHMREQEQCELEQWCLGSERLLVKLCHGPGGMGKTRLALELCRNMQKSGWQAGFLDKHEFELDAPLWREALSSGQPLLLVLDYAQDRTDAIRWLVKQVTDVKGRKVRLLLLARKPGEWLQRLKSHSPAQNIFTGPAFTKSSLGPVSVAQQDRRRSWAIANRDLSAALQMPPVAKPPEDLGEDHFERVLLLQMSVLASLDGVQVKGENGLLDYVLNRERSFWSQQLKMHNLQESLVEGLGQALAAVTFNMGVKTEADGLRVLKGLRFFAGQSEATLYTLNTILADCYPGAQWIEPVQPDLLGERLSDVSTDDPVVKEDIYRLFQTR